MLTIALSSRNKTLTAQALLQTPNLKKLIFKFLFDYLPYSIRVRMLSKSKVKMFNSNITLLSKVRC